MSDSNTDEQPGSDPLDPKRGLDDHRPVEHDEGPLAESPTIGGSGASGSVAVLPEGAEEHGHRTPKT